MSNKNRNKRALDDNLESINGEEDSKRSRQSKKEETRDDCVDSHSDSDDEQNLDDQDEINPDGDSDDEYDDDDDDDGDGDEEESDQDLSDKEISVEFTAHDPIESDFHGIKCLLQQLWLKESICCTELTELFMKDTICTVLKQSASEDDVEEDEDDDDNIFGVISIIPFNSYFNEKKCVKQIKQLLLSYLPEDNEIYRRLKDPESTCAVIINERFINLPPKISVPCYQQLLTELNNHKKRNVFDTKYEFDYVILISKLSKYKNEFIYSNPEDEIFSERSEDSYEYSVAKQSDTYSTDWNDDDKTFEPFRKILLLTKAKWIRTINVLKDVV